MKIYKYVSIGFLTILIMFALLIYTVTYIHQDVKSMNPLIFWMVKNHLLLTIILIIISGLIGYVSSTIIYKQVIKTKKESKKLLELLLLFLNKEEKEIINHLVKKNGIAEQAELSRLPGMNRVKTHRALQKMQEKNIITILPHGKIRRAQLKENILKILIEQ